jgi:hypothetical protein
MNLCRRRREPWSGFTAITQDHANKVGALIQQGERMKGETRWQTVEEGEQGKRIIDVDALYPVSRSDGASSVPPGPSHPLVEEIARAVGGLRSWDALWVSGFKPLARRARAPLRQRGSGTGVGTSACSRATPALFATWVQPRSLARESK